MTERIVSVRTPKWAKPFPLLHYLWSCYRLYRLGADLGYTRIQSIPLTVIVSRRPGDQLVGKLTNGN